MSPHPSSPRAVKLCPPCSSVFVIEHSHSGCSSTSSREARSNDSGVDDSNGERERAAQSELDRAEQLRLAQAEAHRVEQVLAAQAECRRKEQLCFHERMLSKKRSLTAEDSNTDIFSYGSKNRPCLGKFEVSVLFLLF